MCVRSMMHAGMHISILKSTVLIYMYNCIRIFTCKYISVCENVSVRGRECARAPAFIYNIPLVRCECDCDNERESSVYLACVCGFKTYCITHVHIPVHVCMWVRM